jgi:hypothetical protein
MANHSGSDWDHRIDAGRQAGEQAAEEGGRQRGEQRGLQVGVDMEEESVDGVTVWLWE